MTSLINVYINVLFNNLRMKASFKLVLLVIALLFSSARAVITIKRLTPYEIDNFVLYRSRSLISSYKTEETVKTPTLLNYLPVKIKLVGGPQVEIKATPEDEKMEK